MIHNIFRGVGLSYSVMVISACTPLLEKTSVLPMLPHLAYSIEATQSGKAALRNGFYSEPASPGSSMKTTVTLSSHQAEGDINQDGLNDAAAVLIADTGGSGTFYYLTAVMNSGEGTSPLNSVFLGDRISVQSLSISGGRIHLDLLTHRLDETLSTTPAVEESFTFKVENSLVVKE